jgi:RNA polymerase sigma-70 factor (ECF subfamily)
VEPAAGPESDESLVARCRAGDPQAFERLFERHQARVFRVALHIVRDREGALDVVQETFVRAYWALDRYAGKGAFGGWLIRIAANLAVDGVRRRRRAGWLEALRGPDEAPEVPSPDGGPEASVESVRLREALERAMGRLAPMQRIVLVMKEIEGLSCEEIAAALRCSVGTVMSRLHYARARMRRLLRRWQPAR